MNDFVKWAIVLVVGFLAFRWLQRGLSASANFNAQTYPSGWGSPYYSNGSAYLQPNGPYPYPWGIYQTSRYADGGQVPIFASYSPSDGFAFQYGG